MSNYNSTLQTNNADLQSILNTINTLPEFSEGVELPELANEGTAANLLLNKQLIDSEGNIVTGTMPNNGSITRTMDGVNTKSVSIPAGYTSGGSVSLDSTIDNEVDEQASLIAQIMSAVDNLPEAGSGDGSGGASVETYTGTFTAISPGGIAMASADVYYTNQNLEVQKTTVGGSIVSIVVAKGTLVLVSADNSRAVSGCTRLGGGDIEYTYSIASDFTIELA